MVTEPRSWAPWPGDPAWTCHRNQREEESMWLQTPGGFREKGFVFGWKQ